MMAGGLGDALAVGEEEAAMVREMKPYVEKYKSVTFESFEPVEMRTQVVAGTNYFIKVKTSAAGLPTPRAPLHAQLLARARLYPQHELQAVRSTARAATPAARVASRLHNEHEYPRIIDFDTWDVTHVCKSQLPCAQPCLRLSPSHSRAL
jgi:hypothetical protein